MCNSSNNNLYGLTPASIRWNIVRGDSATLRIDFLENDETTHVNTTGWTYEATSYDAQGDVLDDIAVEPNSGYVILRAPASLTLNWGTRYAKVVAELPFDLQVTIPQGETEEPLVWTPVLGTIVVLGDVSPGGSL